MLTTYLIIAALCSLVTLSWGVYREEDPVYWAVVGLLLGPLAILHLLVSRIPYRFQVTRQKRTEPAEVENQPGIGEAFWSLAGLAGLFVAFAKIEDWMPDSGPVHPFLPFIYFFLVTPLILAALFALFGSALTGASRMIRNRRIYLFSLIPVAIFGWFMTKLL